MITEVIGPVRSVRPVRPGPHLGNNMPYSKVSVKQYEFFFGSVVPAAAGPSIR